MTTTTEHGRRVIDGITHGRNASYILGCRCRPCTTAHNTYEKGRNALRRAKRAEMRDRAGKDGAMPGVQKSRTASITMVVVVCANCGRRGRANSKLVEAMGKKIEKCDECRKAG